MRESFLGFIILDNYNYAAFLESHITFNEDYKKTALSCANYYADTPGQMDTMGDANEGFKKRKELSANSTYLEVESKLHSGIFSQQKALKSRVPMTIEFTVSNPQFAINAPTAAGKFKFEIIEPTLVIQRLKLSSKMADIYEKQWLKQPIDYEFERSKIWVKDVDQGLSTVHLKEFCDDKKLPKRIFLMMVPELAYSGKHHLNPFNFKNYNVKSLNLTLNGQSLTGKPLLMDWTKNTFLQAYSQLLKSLNKFEDMHGCGLTKDVFSKGSSIFGYELSPTCTNLNLIDPVRVGNLEADLIFADTTPEKLKILIFSEYEDKFQLNSMQRVIKVYS